VTAPPTTATDYDYGVHYRVWHDETDAHAAAMAAWNAEILEQFVPSDRTARCLDIGCGMGFALLGLQRLGFQNVSGVDIDHSQVEAAVRRGLPVEQVVDTPAYLRQRPSEYDLVLMFDVLEHIAVAEQISMLRTVYASLRPGGRIVVQVPNANSPLAARWRYGDFTHTSSFTEHSLAFVLANAGFERVATPMQKDPGFPRFPRRFWRPDLWSGFAANFRRWFMRALWRQMCIAELGTGRGADSVSLSLNIVAIAFKAGDSAI